jgi:hypothetical protein
VVIPKLYDGRDRTFFFFNYDGYKNRPGSSGFLVTVPTAQMMTGDFRGIAKIYDPTTTRTLPNGTVVRDEFQCNGALDVICPNRFSAISKNFLPLLPTPDFPGLVNNFTGRLPGAPSTNEYNITLRFDHTISKKQNISFSYAGGPGSSSPSAGNINGLLGPLTAARDFIFSEVVTRFSHTYTVSPTLVNHFTAGFNRDKTVFTDPQEGVNWPDKLGFKGLVPKNTMVSVDFLSDGLVPLHPATFVGSFFENNNNTAFEDTLSWIHGKHSFKFGADIRMSGDNTGVASVPGDFQFTSLTTGLPGVPSTGQAFASFLIGATAGGSQSIQGAGSTGDRWHYLAWYVQDDYKATSKLTLNLGLRYDLPRSRYEVFNRLSTFDPTVPNPGAGNIPGALVFAGFGSGKCNCRSFTDADYKEFGPRFGLAYQLNDKTVFRGGYGLFYTAGGNVGGNAEHGSPLGWSASPSVQSPDGGVTPALYWDNGYPQNFQTPPLFNPTFANGGPINWYMKPGGGRAPYYQNWNINLERQIRPSFLVSAAYAGAKGTRLPTGLQQTDQVNSKYLSLGNLLSADISSPQAQAAIAAGTIPPPPYTGFTGSVAQSLRPYPQYASVDIQNPLDGNSTYHSLQLRLDKRYSNGLQFLVAYTASKTIDNGGSILNGFFGSSGRDQFNRRIEKSLSVNDVPQNLVINYTYELPFGARKRFINHRGAIDKVVGGWQVSGISTYHRGVPIEFVVNNSLGLFNGRNNPDRVPGISPRSNISLSNFNVFGGDSYINLAAFRDPAPFTIGNGPRTWGDLRQPAFYDENVALMKRTYINERANVEFRWETFNALNRTSFVVVTTLRNFPVNIDSGGAGQFSGAQLTGRQMQFSLKLNF